MIPLRHNKVFLKTTDMKNLNSTQIQWVIKQVEESRLEHPAGAEFLIFFDESFKMSVDKNIFYISSVCIK